MNTCNKCGKEYTKAKRKSKVTGVGWAIIIICIFLCFPLALIGLLFREHRYFCPHCNGRIF